MTQAVVISPARESRLGLSSLARETRSLLLSFVRSNACSLDGIPRGEGRTVLVIPGFFAGDWATTAHLRGFLDTLGYRTETAGVAFNLDPTPQLLARLERRLIRLSARGPIDLIGQSFGGVLARDLARRHPERVRKVITLCSPLRVPITTLLAPFVRSLLWLYDRDWLARHAVAQPLPMPATAVYTEDDGVVDWRECVQDEAPGCVNVRVSGAHVTIGQNPEALAAIARALSS